MDISHNYANTEDKEAIRIRAVSDLEEAFNSTVTDSSLEYEGSIFGFFSHIAKLHVEWQKGTGVAERDFLVKLPRASSFNSDVAVGDWGKRWMEFCTNTWLPFIHNNECAAYQYLDKLTGSDGWPLVKTYVSRPLTTSGEKKPALIIVKDLSNESSVRDYSILDGNLLLPCVRFLAKLHAQCYRDNEWQPLFANRPYSQQFAHFWHFAVELFSPHDGFRTYGSQLVRDNFEKIAHFGSVNYYKETERRVEELHLPPVLVHGDLFAGNFLSNEKRQLVSVIDWQFAHLGNPAEDLTRVLVAACNPRLPSVVRTLDIYYGCLKNEMGDTPPPFNREQLRQGVDVLLPFVLAWSLMTIPNNAKLEKNRSAEKQERLLELAHSLTTELLKLTNDVAMH